MTRSRSYLLLILSIPLGAALSYYLQAGGLRILISLPEYLQRIPDFLQGNGYLATPPVRNTILMTTALSFIFSAIGIAAFNQSKDKKVPPES